jgi:hypothetical protein
MAVRVLIVADDLSGAADSAVPFAARLGTAVSLGGGRPDAQVVAVDTDSRYAPEAVARERVARAVARGRADGARIVKKIDSTLRGNIGAEIAAAREAAAAAACPADGGRNGPGRAAGHGAERWPGGDGRDRGRGRSRRGRPGVPRDGTDGPRRDRPGPRSAAARAGARW